jgi:hypothetical protein
MTPMISTALPSSVMRVPTMCGSDPNRRTHAE